MSIYNKRPFTELDDINDVTESQIAKREFDELFNIYDSVGNYKTGTDLQKVLVRLYHRKQAAGFNEFITDNDKFQRDLDNFVNVQLSAEGIVYDESDPAKMKEFNEELQKFFNKNLKIATTPEYQQRLQEIYKELKEIGSKNTKDSVVKELSEYYRQRSAIVALVTDKDGEPNGANLSIDQMNLLKSIEDKIVELNDSFDKKTGLSLDKKNFSHVMVRGVKQITHWGKNPTNNLQIMWGKEHECGPGSDTFENVFYNVITNGAFKCWADKADQWAKAIEFRNTNLKKTNNLDSLLETE